jgi:hypothetical protein
MVGYREAMYQAHAGAPFMAAARCEVCRNAIMRVVILQDDLGNTLEAGRPCAARLHGGPTLAEIRRVQRDHDRERWLASDAARIYFGRESSRRANEREPDPFSDAYRQAEGG